VVVDDGTNRTNSRLLRAEVNEQYAEYARELHTKIKFVHQDETKGARSCELISPELEKLRIKVVTKIREFLLRQIQNLRKPTNVQVRQSSEMVKYKFLNQFLWYYAKDCALEGRLRRRLRWAFA